MKSCILFLFVSLSISFTSTAQQSNPEGQRQPDLCSFGLGAGFDYGGFGANVIVYPQRNIGLFFGGGYAIAGFGYNGGIKLRLIPSKMSVVDPFLIGMYGYNAAIYVSGNTNLNRIFYGPSFGAGIDIHRKRTSKGYFTVAILVPVRNHEVSDYKGELQYYYGVSTSDLLPVSVSVGYKFTLNWFH